MNQSANEALPQGDEQTAADPLEASVALATLVWLAGIGVLAVYSVVSLLRLRRKLIGALPLRENICLADYIDSPFVMGIIHPKIYLPSSLSEQEQGYIILHEQHHIRRGDHIMKALAFLALCIHWFNPLVWVAFILSSKDMEMSCDEAVVKKLGEGIRADYSASLLSLATGRRIIAGTPLAFGEGDTKSRIKNLLNWKRPKVWITVLAAVVCVAIVAACAGNPREEAAETPGDTAHMTGQFANMEEYAQWVMDGKKTAHYYRPDGTEATANVTGTKLAWLEEQGEVADLAPEGTLEAWTFNYLVQVDADPEQIMLVGGMYEEDGWYDLEGQGGHNIVALRHENGSYNLVYNAVVNDNLDFYGYHNSYEEAIYDWYVTENGLDLPLYIKDLVGGGKTIPAHRYDGDGWYLYIPVSGWKQAATSFPDDQWQWVSAYGTGSTLIVDRFTRPVSILHDDAKKQGFAPIDRTNQVWQYIGGNIRYYYLEAANGCWRVTIDWDDSRISDSPDNAMEPEVLRLMAERFTVDDSFQSSAETSQPPEDVSLLPGTGEALAAEELAWFNDWFEPIVQDKQGNYIGKNSRGCFFTSYYDDVTELNFEEFMRYFPGDGSQTSEAEFEALKKVDGWTFAHVNSLAEMMVPVHKYPRRLVDLILSEYAGVSTADLNTEGVAYLPEYDTYYNYTSDAGCGTFCCTRGEKDGDLIRPYDESYGVKLLTLRQVGSKTYQIVSHQLLESSAG